METRSTKRQMGAKGEITMAFRPRIVDPDATEQNGILEYKHPVNSLNYVCRRKGLVPSYSLLPAGPRGRKWVCNLILMPLGQTFEHRRPEKKQAIAKVEVASRAMRFLQLRDVASEVNEPFLNRSTTPPSLIPNPLFEPLEDFLVMLVQRNYRFLSPLLSRTAELIELLEENSSLKAVYIKLFERERTNLLVKSKEPQSLNPQIALVTGNMNPNAVLDSEDDTPDSEATLKFAYITSPLAHIRFTSRPLASQVGEELARKMMRRTKDNVSASKIDLAFRNISSGMLDVSDRPGRQTSVLVPTTSPQVPPNHLPSDDRNMSRIANRLKAMFRGGTEEEQEDFFRDVGVRLMLRMEQYPRSMALAFQEGFEQAAKELVRLRESQEQEDNAAQTEGAEQEGEQEDEQADVSMASCLSA